MACRFKALGPADRDRSSIPPLRSSALHHLAEPMAQPRLFQRKEAKKGDAAHRVRKRDCHQGQHAEVKTYQQSDPNLGETSVQKTQGTPEFRHHGDETQDRKNPCMSDEIDAERRMGAREFEFSDIVIGDLYSQGLARDETKAAELPFCYTGDEISRDGDQTA